MRQLSPCLSIGFFWAIIHSKVIQIFMREYLAIGSIFFTIIDHCKSFKYLILFLFQNQKYLKQLICFYLWFFGATICSKVIQTNFEEMFDNRFLFSSAWNRWNDSLHLGWINVYTSGWIKVVWPSFYKIYQFL